MSRNDHRIAEALWRSTKQRQHAAPGKPYRKLTIGVMVSMLIDFLFDNLRLILLVALILGAVYYTSPQHKFEECNQAAVPRHCVD